MGVKKKMAEHGDRVSWDDRMGTIIDLHKKGDSFSVLPDDGPKRHFLWPKAECVVLDDIPLTCPRCGTSGHRAQSCQAEYVAWKQARTLQEWDVTF